MMPQYLFLILPQYLTVLPYCHNIYLIVMPQYSCLIMMPQYFFLILPQYLSLIKLPQYLSYHDATISHCLIMMPQYLTFLSCCHNISLSCHVATISHCHVGIIWETCLLHMLPLCIEFSPYSYHWGT